MAVIHSDAPPVHRPWRRNLGFGLGSVLLLLGTLWMVYFDYHREWKGYQRQFRAMERQRAEEGLRQEGERLAASQELATLEQQMEQARSDLQQHESDLTAAREALGDTERLFYKAEQNWKIDKSFYDARKYEFEEERRHIMESGRSEGDKRAAVARAEEHFLQFEQRYRQAVLDLEKATVARDEATKTVRSLTGRVDDLNKAYARMTERETAVQMKLEANTSSLATLVRNAPVVDLAAPTLRIDQVILPNLMSDINFTLIPKVDRCVTCHKGVMDASYENEAEPFRAHPRLDLYLLDNTPHPYNKFGCTICHQGLDRATSFASAMHTPRDEQQEHEWHERYGWHAPHYWDFPQLSAQHSQAACRTCHIGEVRVRGADRYNRGLDMVESAGCYGCHKIAGYEARRKTGPDLRRVASKLSPEWAYHWIENPSAYRPTTWMPRFFHLSNSNSPEDQARSRVEIAAMVSYLFAKSEPYRPAVAQAPAGDASRGARLVAERGCLGCHRIGESPTARGAYGRDFGPALDRVGDKVDAEWLYDWVRDPKRYFPETNMPDLRLTDQEAADVTAHLMTLRKESAAPAPAVDDKLLDEITVEYLRARLTNDQAMQKLSTMGQDEKKVFLGEKLISRYGCFGCHQIAGFEQALPIGVELSQEGTKMITRLDFGFVEIPHTKPAWFLQKMKDPRIFDMGKVKAPQEKLKMPDYGFSDEEAETLVTLIMSMQKDVQPMASHRMLDERSAAVERGRRIVQDRNCRGCHILEEQGGEIRETIAEQAYHPPNLFGEGNKVQSDWLFEFLKEPSSIRPWLNVRMPTFGFDDREATDVVKFFASLDGATYPFHSTSAAPANPEILRQGQATFEQFKCISCHTVGAIPPGVSVADLAPDLSMARQRLRHDWIEKWLRDPQKLMPGTRMPGFFYSDDQPLYPDADVRMKAVSEYLLTLGQPARRDRRVARSESAGR